MNYKPTPNLLDWYYEDEIKNYRFEILPESKARLEEKFKEESIPDFIREDLIWIWGYMKSKYDSWYNSPQTAEKMEEQEKKEMKRKNVAAIYNRWVYDKTLSELFKKSKIKSITVDYMPERGYVPEPTIIDTEDFIQFICEAIEQYEILTKDTYGAYFATQAHKANEMNYYNEKILTPEGRELNMKRYDGKRIFWFLNEHLPGFSDRAIFRFGAWLMFDAGVRFKDAYKAVPVSDATYDVEKASLTFGFWANARGKQATQKNPFLIDDAFEDFMREYGDV